MDGRIGIGLLDFSGDFVGVTGAKISDGGTDIVTVGFFEVDVFGNNRVVAVADDEKVGFCRHAGYLMGLTLFDEASEFFTV